jgi:hypothetical protein
MRREDRVADAVEAGRGGERDRLVERIGAVVEEREVVAVEVYHPISLASNTQS